MKQKSKKTINKKLQLIFNTSFKLKKKKVKIFCKIYNFKTDKKLKIRKKFLGLFNFETAGVSFLKAYYNFKKKKALKG